VGRIFVPRAIPGAANTGPTARPRRFSFVACCAFNTRRRGPKSNTTVAVFPARRCPSTESVPGISSRRPVRLPPSRLVRIGSRACGNRSVPVSVPNRRTPRRARIAQLQAEEILREDAASRPSSPMSRLSSSLRVTPVRAAGDRFGDSRRRAPTPAPDDRLATTLSENSRVVA
jgi:hypothetical protein